MLRVQKKIATNQQEGRMRNPPTMERTCAGCGKTFTSHKRGLSWVKYCNPKCYRLNTLYGGVCQKTKYV